METQVFLTHFFQTDVTCLVSNSRLWPFSHKATWPDSGYLVSMVTAQTSVKTGEAHEYDWVETRRGHGMHTHTLFYKVLRFRKREGVWWKLLSLLVECLARRMSNLQGRERKSDRLQERDEDEKKKRQKLSRGKRQKKNIYTSQPKNLKKKSIIIMTVLPCCCREWTVTGDRKSVV